MPLNHVLNHKICNLEENSYVSKSSLSPCFFGAFQHSHILDFYSEVLAEPYYCPEDDRFGKLCQTPLNHRFQLDLWCLQSERHFEAVTVKFSLNAITTKKIAYFQNSVTPL